MSTALDPLRDPPRILSLRIRNFRALRDFELSDLTPLTVLVGPNGSGKSTVFDALEFLSDCFRKDLPVAWKEKGGTAGVKTRGQTGPVALSFTYRLEPDEALMAYEVAFDEVGGAPVVLTETLVQVHPQRTAGEGGNEPLLERRGKSVRAGTEDRDGGSLFRNEQLTDGSALAASVLGQLNAYHEIEGLRSFIRNWHVSRLSLSAAWGESGPTVEDRLTPTGNNIASVVMWLQHQEPERLRAIIEKLRRDVPYLSGVAAEVTEAARLRLTVLDSPFDRGFHARRVSDGTLTLLAQLLLLQGGEPYALLCLDEPENNLHPRLHLDLAESCRAAGARSQLIVATHSPEFLGGVRAEELRVLYRDELGYSHAVRAADIRGVPEFLAAGATLGHLWMEGHFGVGDPQVRGGRPAKGRP
jgi:predicted ATPase